MGDDLTGDTRRALSRQWIKANVLGGVAYAAAIFANSLIASLLWTEAGYTTVALAMVAVASVVTQSFGFVVLGYLTGVVLRRKLPLLPLRAWLILHGLIGAVLGLLIGAVVSIVGNELDTREPDDLFVLPALLIAVGILGALSGGALGGFQALVLRRTAKGLKSWIGYSSLAGMVLMVMVPIDFYGPASGLVRELLDAVAVILGAAAGAFIMLPALHRLAPR